MNQPTETGLSPRWTALARCGRQLQRREIPEGPRTFEVCVRSAHEEELMSYDLWKLGTYAGYAESGWFWTELREGAKGLVHPDRDCAHPDCPEAGTRHRHTPGSKKPNEIWVNLRCQIRELPNRHDRQRHRGPGRSRNITPGEDCGWQRTCDDFRPGRTPEPRSIARFERSAERRSRDIAPAMAVRPRFWGGSSLEVRMV